jgi:hypothetical protein
MTVVFDHAAIASMYTFVIKSLFISKEGMVSHCHLTGSN